MFWIYSGNETSKWKLLQLLEKSLQLVERWGLIMLESVVLQFISIDVVAVAKKMNKLSED